jgi:hypothetical protein
MSWGAAMTASVAAALDRPRWWLLALAGFLLRGGLLVFLLPILILPTPAGLANAVAPTLVGFVFGSPSPSFVTLLVVVVAAALAWLLFGGLLAAWVELALIAEVAGESDVAVPHGSGLALRALVVRLISHGPLALILAWAVTRLVEAVYAEIVSPGDVTTPIVIRVVLRIPEVIVLLVAGWLAGEAAGGLAVRHLALRPGVSAWRSLGRAWLDLATRPSVAATLVLTTLGVAIVAVPTAAAAGYAWGRLREALASHADPVIVTITLCSFVGLWLGGLALVGVAVAWRSSAWTLETARHLLPAAGHRHAAVRGAV